MKRTFTKIIAGLCSIILSCSMITMTSYADDDIQVILDGTELSFDVPPQIIEGRTMVPMRAIFEALGYEVLWNEKNQSIFAHSVAANLVVGLTVGSNKIITGDIYGAESSATTLIDVPPQIIDGRTFVPVRAISEVSGYDIQWDEEKRQIVITTDIDYDYITPPYSIDTIQDTFDDISTNIEQINSFIKQGMYLEAIEECEQTAAWHKLSQNDYDTLSELKSEAQTKYNEYKYDRLKSLITDENKKIMFEKCKKYISRTLKSPSTAIWPNYNGDNVYYDTIEESNLITIAFSYEATNSFGAYLQSSVIYAFNENLELCDMLGRVIE